MSTDIGFNIPSVTSENLRLLSKRAGVVSEMRICELSELASFAADYARELSDGGLGVYEFLSLLSEEISFSSREEHQDVLSQNSKRLKALLDSTGAFDKIFFAELLSLRLGERGIELTEKHFFPGYECDELITYVKNAYSDEAFDVFSQEFSNARLRYSKTFKEAARAVAEGEVGYALLPLEEAGGTRLPSVTELIYKNDLKINSLTPVFGPDGASELKYALVSKNVRVPSRLPDDDVYLEIRLDASSSDSLRELMLAASATGAEVYRVNTLTFDAYGDKESFFDAVLRRESGDFTTLLVYLTLFCEDFTALGMYKNLE